MRTVLVLIFFGCLLSGCAHTDTGRWRAAGFCVGESLLRAALGAAVRLTSAPPADGAGYAAFGRELAGAYGPGAVRCAAEALLAEAPPVVAEVAEPRPVGFVLPPHGGGITAGPRSPDAGPGASGTLTSSTAAPSRALAAWLLANPSAWDR